MKANYGKNGMGAWIGSTEIWTDPRAIAPTVTATPASPAPSTRSTASPKQMDLLKTLFAERAANAEVQTLRAALLVEYREGRLTLKLASSMISYLFTVAKDTRPVEAPAQSDVADGYYAIESSGDNDLVFYRVTSSEKWGKSVQMIVGGHADRFVARKAVAGILARIAADPDAAARYGRELGQCCACNRTLTDEESRRLGIGPKCRAGGRD